MTTWGGIPLLTIFNRSKEATNSTAKGTLTSLPVSTMSYCPPNNTPRSPLIHVLAWALRYLSFPLLLQEEKGGIKMSPVFL